SSHLQLSTPSRVLILLPLLPIFTLFPYTTLFRSQFTYISLDDFRIIFDQLYGKGKRKVSDRNLVPYSVFITPALSRVGLNEVEAKNKGIEYKLFKLAATSIPKTKVIGNTREMYKILIDQDTE